MGRSRAVKGIFSSRSRNTHSITAVCRGFHISEVRACLHDGQDGVETYNMIKKKHDQESTKTKYMLNGRMYLPQRLPPILQR